MPDSLKPDGTAIRALRSPPDVMEPVPNSPRRPPPAQGAPGGTAVRAFRARQEAQYHRIATLAGQQENRRDSRGVRKPLSDYRIARPFCHNRTNGTQVQ